MEPQSRQQINWALPLFHCPPLGYFKVFLSISKPFKNLSIHYEFSGNTMYCLPCYSQIWHWRYTPAYPWKEWEQWVIIIWGQESYTHQSTLPAPLTLPPNLFLSLSSPSQNTTPVIHKPRGLLWGIPPLPTAPCPQSFQCFVQNIVLVHFSAVTTVVLVPSSPTQGIPTIVPSLHLSSTSFLQQPEGSTYCMNHLVSLPYIDPSNGILPLID